MASYLIEIEKEDGVYKCTPDKLDLKTGDVIIFHSIDLAVPVYLGGFEKGDIKDLLPSVPVGMLAPPFYELKYYCHGPGAGRINVFVDREPSRHEKSDCFLIIEPRGHENQ